MNTIVLTTFIVEGVSIPFKIASKNEPNKVQVLEKLKDIIKYYELSGTIKSEKFVQEKDLKLYVYTIGDLTAMITVERLELMEFDK